MEGKKDIITITHVISGGSVDTLAKSIADKLNANFISTDTRVFSDGESKQKLEGKITNNSRVIIVQSLYMPVDTNLFRLLCLISKAKEYTSDITVVIPYVGYARQDAEFLSGEIITIKVLGILLKKAGAKKIIVVDIHSTKGLKMLGTQTTNVTAVPVLARYFDSMQLENPIVISPDKGGTKRAEHFAKELGCGLLILEKSRDRKTGVVRIKTKKADIVKGRDVIIIDDMISTGGSIVKASEFLKKQHSNKIFAACTHALLVEGAKTKIRKAGVSKIISANTIPNKTAIIVDVSDAIVQYLKK